MANKVYNLNGGLYSGDAFTAFETRIASSNNGSIVASPSDLKVSAGSGMNVTVATGAGIIGNGTLSGVRFAIDAPVTVAVNAASTANPRMDSVVAYIDKSVSASTSVVDNTDLGIVKFKSVAGTPASAPTAPSTATIQSSIGAGNPYMVLANVTVPKSSSAASSFKITDMRVTPTSAIITDNSITTSKLANKAVTSDKVDWATFATENGVTSTVSVGTSFVTLKTFAINKDGNYIIWAKGTRSGNYTVGALITMRILKNEAAINAVDCPTVANYAGNHDVITQIMASFPASAGDTVSIQISKDRTDFGSNLGCLYMFAQIA